MIVVQSMPCTTGLIFVCGRRRAAGQSVHHPVGVEQTTLRTTVLIVVAPMMALDIILVVESRQHSS